MKEIVRAEVDDARRFLLVNTVETYPELEEHEMEHYRSLLEQEPSLEVAAMELTWAEELEARGREAGFTKGQEAGFTQGQEAGLVVGAREIITR